MSLQEVVVCNWKIFSWDGTWMEWLCKKCCVILIRE